MISEGQRKLIGHLVRIMRDESEERQQRWGQNSELVGKYAAEGRLLIARDWTADMVLTVTGEVVVVDTEDGKPDTQADDRERRRSLFRAIHVFPELLSLLPKRPDQAVECPHCNGTGVPEGSLVNRKLRNVECYCSGAGWLLPGDAPGV